MSTNMLSSNPYNKYKETSINTAPPAKLLLMLYDGIIKLLHQAVSALEDNNIVLTNEILKKVQAIIIELMVTLDMEKGGEIATNLYRLYDFYLNEVIQANIKKDVQRLNPVIGFFQQFRETWAEAAKRTIMESAK
jgi:flagellar secretion chaperone FliS